VWDREKGRKDQRPGSQGWMGRRGSGELVMASGGDLDADRKKTQEGRKEGLRKVRRLTA